jgi:hypothetical protein
VLVAGPTTPSQLREVTREVGRHPLADLAAELSIGFGVSQQHAGDDT